MQEVYYVSRGGMNATTAHVQANSHSFIVKIWTEDSGEVAGRASWRGRITHVPSGQSKGFVNTDEIALFIWPYLHSFGVQKSWRWKLRHLLHRTDNAR